MPLGHKVLIYCSELIGEIRKNEARDEKLLIETLHLTLCEEMTLLEAKPSAFFQFWGHNVPINCSKLLGIIHVSTCTCKIDKVMKKRKF